MCGKSAQRSPEAKLAGFMASHDGVVSRTELQAVGLSSDAVDQRSRTGRLHRIHRGVYSLTPSLPSRGHARAGVLACGNDAVLSHRSAAHLHGLFRAGPSRIEVTVPTRAGRAKRHGITLHRCVLTAGEIATEGHIPLTSLPAPSSTRPRSSRHASSSPPSIAPRTRALWISTPLGPSSPQTRPATAPRS